MAGRWQLDAYVDARPGAALLELLQGLIPSAKGRKPVVEELVEQDWVTLSQQGLEPVRAGRFFVHTSSYADRVPPGTTSFLIDASQAFGTGGHDTTAGCLAMLDRLVDANRMQAVTLSDLGATFAGPGGKPVTLAIANLKFSHTGDGVMSIEGAFTLDGKEHEADLDVDAPDPDAPDFKEEEDKPQLEV